MSTRYISPIAGLLLLRRNERLLGFYLYVRTVLTALGPKIEAMYKSLVLLAEGRQMANVYLHFDRSLLEGYCPIIMYSYDFERSDVRWLVFVCALVSHYYFISYLIVMFNSRTILSTIIFIDYLLFSLLYRSPIGNMPYIKNHVSSKDELSWGCFQSCVISTSDAVCCCR